MGNLCSIFHARFNLLVSEFKSSKKAILIDYILLNWQNSKYKLNGTDKKWFMKPYQQIIEETGFARSTLGRYLKELEDAGYIERCQKLYSRKLEDVFQVKKGAYINLTDKLLAIIIPPNHAAKKPTITAPKAIPSHTNTSNPPNEDNLNGINPSCLNNEKNGIIEDLNMGKSYISDLFSSCKNNIIFNKTTQFVDKEQHRLLQHQFEAIQNFLTQDVKEEIPEAVKKLVRGTFYNLTFKHRVVLSAPAQVAAEYLFELLNIDFYMPEAKTLTHRNNILALILRKKNWHTPKGFYKHFYLGQQFKDKNDMRESQWNKKKTKEIEHTPDIRLLHLESKMQEKYALIEKCKEQLLQESSEEGIGICRDKINTLRKELENLWQQQTLLEEELDKLNGYEAHKLCA